MTSLTIPDLDPNTEQELRSRANSHGRSVQDEARTILESALSVTEAEDEVDLYTYIRSLVDPIGGVDDLVLPPREVARDLPSFD